MSLAASRASRSRSRKRSHSGNLLHPRAHAGSILIMNPTTAYQELLKELREISLLNSVGALLGWDEQTQLPPAGTEHRANQSSMIARMTHERFTSPRVGELLAAVEGSELVKDPESDAAANVR